MTAWSAETNALYARSTSASRGLCSTTSIASRSICSISRRRDASSIVRSQSVHRPRAIPARFAQCAFSSGDLNAQTRFFVMIPGTTGAHGRSKNLLRTMADEALLEEHGAQLRELRETQGELMREVSATTEKVNDLAGDVSRGFADAVTAMGKISSKIDVAFHDEKQGIYTRLRTVEETHSRWGARIKWVGAVLTSLMLAVLGSIVVAAVRK